MKLSFPRCGWFLAVTLSLGALVPTRGDWPQHLGPDRNGTAPGGSPIPWPATGPVTLWKAPVGGGFSGPVAAGDLVLLHHRLDDREVLEAFDRVTGKSRWKAAQPTAYSDDFGFDDGPRGTPCVSGEWVYTFGAEGRLSAVRLRDGQAGWTVALGKDSKADKGFFGFACSPLVVSNRVIVQLGGEDGAGVVAVDAASGKRVWKSTDDEAGYASPVAATVAGGLRIVVFNRAGVRVLEPQDGKILASFPWRARQQASVNAATPLVGPDGIFVTASYNVGAALLRWSGTGAIEPVWTNDDTLSSHISTPVRRGNWIYGFHGRQEQGAAVHCIEATTGRLLWESPRTGVGSIVLAGKSLVVLLESGELILAEASERAWKPLCRAQIMGTGVRAAPALDGDVFLARDRKQLIAVRIPREPADRQP